MSKLNSQEEENRKKEINHMINHVNNEIERLILLREQYTKELEKPLSNNPKIDRFLKTNSGKDLLKKHNLQEKGYWEVRGEDPNCDLHGSHYTPLIGYYFGTLEDVLKIAVEDHRFYTWGAGGEIKKMDINEVK